MKTDEAIQHLITAARYNPDAMLAHASIVVKQQTDSGGKVVALQLTAALAEVAADHQRQLNLTRSR